MAQKTFTWGKSTPCQCIVFFLITETNERSLKAEQNVAFALFWEVFSGSQNQLLLSKSTINDILGVICHS